MPTQSKLAQNKLYLYWQAEAIRLFESKQKNFSDTAIQNLVINQYQDFDQRVLYRADLIAKQEKIDLGLSNWFISAKLAIISLWLLALISGIGVAAGALAQAHVNLASALIALLGLHLISFIFWLISYLPIAKPDTGLSSIWLWLSKKITKSNHSQLAAKSFLSLFIRQKMWPPAIGIITHSTWIAAFIGALLTLLILLSTRNYSFYWATTLLTDDAIINLSKIIGYIPAILGLSMPDSIAITASLNNINSSNEIHSQWSVWLIGCIIVWGLLPRLIALFFCLLSLLSKFNKLKIDPKLPAWMELKNRYSPRAENLGIDKPANKIQQLFKPTYSKPSKSNKAAILGYELDTNFNWPPFVMTPNISDLGIASSRADQSRIRKTINASTNLLLVCNTNLTPDRGTINWLHELQDLSASLSIYCPDGARTKLWQQMINEQGFFQTSSTEQWQSNLLRPL